MSSRNFRQLLEAQWAKDHFVCVGLDPDRAKIGLALGQAHVTDDDVFNFLRQIIDATVDLAATYKPNRGFFGGHKRAILLHRTMQYLRDRAPESCHILDAKYGDIGNSNKGYVEEAYDIYGADAFTAHSFMGLGTWDEALERQDKGIFCLCRTSNPEAAEFQEERVALKLGGVQSLVQSWSRYPEGIEKNYGWEYFTSKRSGDSYVLIPAYEHVALAVAALKNPNVGLVVGATAPEQLARVRLIAPALPMLIPGVGKQGGKIEEVVPAVRDQFLINASSSVLYAFEKRGGDFAEAARAEVEEMTRTINQHREVLTTA